MQQRDYGTVPIDSTRSALPGQPHNLIVQTAQPSQPGYANGTNQPYPETPGLGQSQVIYVQEQPQIPADVHCCWCISINSANQCMIFLGVLSILQIIGQVQQYTDIGVHYVAIPVIIVCILQAFTTIAFIYGLVRFQRTDPELRDNACKLMLVRQWHWQYTSVTIQGLGMAFANIVGYWLKSEHSNQYWNIHSNCMQSVRENPLTGKLAETAAELPAGGYDTRMDSCMKIHVSKKLATEHLLYHQNPSKTLTFISGSYILWTTCFIIGMIINLLFTAWYHQSYKQWYAREQLIDANKGATMTVIEQEVEMIQSANQSFAQSEHIKDEDIMAQEKQDI